MIFLYKKYKTIFSNWIQLLNRLSSSSTPGKKNSSRSKNNLLLPATIDSTLFSRQDIIISLITRLINRLNVPSDIWSQVDISRCGFVSPFFVCVSSTMSEGEMVCYPSVKNNLLYYSFWTVFVMSDNLLNCSICFEGYNEKQRVPLILECGHTMCKLYPECFVSDITDWWCEIFCHPHRIHHFAGSWTWQLSSLLWANLWFSIDSHAGRGFPIVVNP